ncbi:MAG: hypothetical protein ABIL09_13200, partial [Gemmatimonadota bacterium]
MPITVLILVAAALSLPVAATEVPVAPDAVAVDGDLREWGGATRIGLAPGAAEVGLRGAFSGPGDHQADLYVMWDARYLYVAAAVTDDSLDAGQVRPGEREWRGAGTRRDRMFYYDHLKVFVRGPGADTGTNLWVAPAADGHAAYAWGGRQRRPPAEDTPALVASAVHLPVYTYEVALPWPWLEIYPEPDMELDALLLVTDSDMPGAEVQAKVASGEGKWIWWEGHLELRGQPHGWLPPPSEEDLVAPGAAAAAEEDGGDELVARAIARARGKRLEAQRDSAAAANRAQEPRQPASQAGTVMDAA